MAFIICLLTITSPYNFQFLGLETNLLILSQMGLLYVSLFGNPLIAGLLAAITCLIRPDSILFAIPIILLSKRLIKTRVALAFIIPGILWEGFSLAYFSDWLPQTFHAKKGLSNINDFLVIALPGISKITFISQQHAPYLWASLNLITTLGCLANKRIRNSMPLVYALLIYPWVLIAAYASIGSPPGHSWEYRSAIVFNTIALMLGFFQILELSSNKFISLFIRERLSIQKIMQYTFVFGVLLLVTNNTQNHIQRIQSEKTEYWWGGRHHTYLMVADWLRENITDKDKVLYGEPGTIAYFSGHFITDNFLISHVGLEGVNYLIKQGDITNWDEAEQSFYRVKFFDKDGFEPISILRKQL